MNFFFNEFSSGATVSPEQEKKITEFQKQIDSVKKQNSFRDSTEVFPFNPHYITDYKGYSLGMSVGEIGRLHS